MIASAKKAVEAVPLYAALTSILIAIALIVGLFEAVGVDPLVAAGVMWKSTFGSLRTFGEGLVRATPLLMISATLLPSLRAGLYNIGAPGQLGAGPLPPRSLHSACRPRQAGLSSRSAPLRRFLPAARPRFFLVCSRRIGG